MNTIASSEESPDMQEVDMTKLNLQQLQQLNQQLEEELGVFQNSLQSLKMAQRRYVESKDSLEKLTPETDGKSIMVPLSGCIYVPGKVTRPNSVIIDIGTGYYVEKDLEGARDYFKRRIAFITEQMQKIQGLCIDKSRIRDAVMEVRDMKIQAELAAQKQLAAKS